MNHGRIAPIPNSKKRTGTPGAHLLPTGWKPKGRTVARWATRLGIPGSEVIQKYLPDFTQSAIDRGFLYRDWDAAFASCLRKDWHGVRVTAPASSGTVPSTPRARGRPTIEHDNQRVLDFVVHYSSAFDLGQDRPSLDDVLTGATHCSPHGNVQATLHRWPLNPTPDRPWRLSRPGHSLLRTGKSWTINHPRKSSATIAPGLMSVPFGSAATPSGESNPGT